MEEPMDRELERAIRSTPAEMFREPAGEFAKLSPAERLRWLQHTAWFVWKHKRVARERDTTATTGEKHSP